MSNGGYSEIGQSFLLPQQGQGQAGSAPSTGARADSQFKPMDPVSGIAPGTSEEDEYFKTVADLNQFVEQQVAKGIDPTAPDITDPDSMMANSIFREKKRRAMQLGSELKFKGDLQKQRSLLEMQGKVMQEQMGGAPGMVSGKPQVGSIQDISRTIQSGAHPVVEGFNKTYAKGVPSDGIKVAEEEKAQAMEALRDEAARMKMQGHSDDDVMHWLGQQEALLNEPFKQAPRSSGYGQKQATNKKLITERTQKLQQAQLGHGAEYMKTAKILGHYAEDVVYNPVTNKYDLYKNDEFGDPELDDDGNPKPYGSINAGDAAAINRAINDTEEAKIPYDAITLAEKEGYAYSGELPEAIGREEYTTDTVRIDTEIDNIFHPDMDSGSKEQNAIEETLRGFDGIDEVMYDDNIGDADVLSFRITNDDGTTEVVEVTLTYDKNKKLTAEAREKLYGAFGRAMKFKKRAPIAKEGADKAESLRNKYNY